MNTETENLEALNRLKTTLFEIFTMHDFEILIDNANEFRLCPKQEFLIDPDTQSQVLKSKNESHLIGIIGANQGQSENENLPDFYYFNLPKVLDESFSMAVHEEYFEFQKTLFDLFKSGNNSLKRVKSHN